MTISQSIRHSAINFKEQTDWGLSHHANIDVVSLSLLRLFSVYYVYIFLCSTMMDYGKFKVRFLFSHFTDVSSMRIV